MKMGTPVLYEIRDSGPQFLNILGSPILYDIRDPSMNSGTPMNFFFFVLLNFAITMHTIMLDTSISVNMHVLRAKYN